MYELIVTGPRYAFTSYVLTVVLQTNVATRMTS